MTRGINRMPRPWLISILLSSVISLVGSLGCQSSSRSPHRDVGQQTPLHDISSEQGTPEIPSSDADLSTISASSAPSSSTLPAQELSDRLEDVDAPFQYARYEQPTSVVHIVRIHPSSSLEIGVSLADEGLATVEQQAQDLGAIAAINAGFFDPHNQKTTSFVTVDGAIVADPRENERLIRNPTLQPYLDAILNRSEFRHMVCGERILFRIAFRGDPLPDPACMLQDAVGGGPQLLPTLQSVEEGFLDYGENGQIIRDAIGSLSSNARSALGITEDGAIVFVVVAQRPDVGDRTGLSLPELADFLTSVGIQAALGLDGGSSSGLYVDGTMHYGRFSPEGAPIERPVKSIVFVRQRASPL